MNEAIADSTHEQKMLTESITENAHNLVASSNMSQRVNDELTDMALQFQKHSDDLEKLVKVFKL